jgi:GNAT superfamily N-acetyltransferase
VPVTGTCECGHDVTAVDEAGFGDAFLAHVRRDHTDWPYPDVAVRNYGEALLRLTGPSERLDTIGAVEIVPVVEAGGHDRLDDWTAFFDHDGFVGRPEWAACYCSEPHLLSPISGPPATVATGAAAPDDGDGRTWQQNRATMQERLRSGGSYGYLAYVDGRPAGWVNASRRGDYALFRLGDLGDGDDQDVVGISCFVIAPPYRRHGLAARLLDRVIEDAHRRGATAIEAYPFHPTARGNDDANFRGARSLYEERGFEAVEERERYTVMRRPVSAPGS